MVSQYHADNTVEDHVDNTVEDHVDAGTVLWMPYIDRPHRSWKQQYLFITELLTQENQ